jgi:hypothetical protein
MHPTFYDWLKAGICFLISAWFAYRAFNHLKRYTGWQSPWKRLLGISPIILGLGFLTFVMIFTS